VELALSSRQEGEWRSQSRLAGPISFFLVKQARHASELGPILVLTSSLNLQYTEKKKERRVEEDTGTGQ
jgi:hypothetical protein